MKTGTDVLYYHGDHLGSTQIITQTGATQNNLCSTQPIRIAGATPRYYNTVQEAYNNAADGDVIEARAVNFIEDNVTFDKDISVTIKGGYDCGYTVQIDNSELQAMGTVNAGTVTMGNFEIVALAYPKLKADEVRYRPFGETLLEAGELTVNHKYTSQELDSETGLYNYNARFYNPALGRFISADSTVPDYTRPQALNRFSYVLNNPLYYKDPTGKAFTGFHWLSELIGASIGALFGSGINPLQAANSNWTIDKNFNELRQSALIPHANSWIDPLTQERVSSATAINAAWNSLNLSKDSIAQTNHTFYDIMTHLGWAWNGFPGKDFSWNPETWGTALGAVGHGVFNDFILGAAMFPVATIGSIGTNVYAAFNQDASKNQFALNDGNLSNQLLGGNYSFDKSLYYDNSYTNNLYGNNYNYNLYESRSFNSSLYYNGSSGGASLSFSWSW